MRKASVISVIVAGVIIIAGIIVCAFGGAYAKKDNFMLFPASENGESVYKYDFTGQEIARISITTEDADVYFKRGGESSYIENLQFQRKLLQAVLRKQSHNLHTGQRRCLHVQILGGRLLLQGDEIHFPFRCG